MSIGVHIDRLLASFCVTSIADKFLYETYELRSCPLVGIDRLLASVPVTSIADEFLHETYELRSCPLVCILIDY